MSWASPGSRPRSNQLQLQGPSGEGKAGDTHPKAAEQGWGSPYLTRETGLAGGGQSSVRVHRGQVTCRASSEECWEKCFKIRPCDESPEECHSPVLCLVPFLKSVVL